MSSCGGNCQCGGNAAPAQTTEASEDVFSVEALEASLMNHAQEACARARTRLGASLSYANLEQFLSDEACVRFPTTIRFTTKELSPHQFAEPVIVDDGPAKRCVLHIHPRYEGQHDAIPYFVAYMAPVINYGQIVPPELCEAYGAQLLGLEQETYYERLCAFFD